MEIKMVSYKPPFLVILLLTFLVVARTSVSAQILYDNGAPGLGVNGFGSFADTGDPTYSMAGDVFTPTLSGTAYAINFAGLYYNGLRPGTAPAIDTFVISLYSTSGGAPVTTVSPLSPLTSTLSNVSRVVLGSGNTRTVYQFSGLLDTPLPLTAGTSYYLGINDTSSTYQDFAIDNTANPFASAAGFSLSSTGFVASTDTLSFQLVVPEPSEWALIALGGVGLVIARKLRSRFSAL